MTTKRQEKDIERLLTSLRETVAKNLASLSQPTEGEVARKEAVAA